MGLRNVMIGSTARQQLRIDRRDPFDWSLQRGEFLFDAGRRLDDNSHTSP
jgi:hypothetical protein